MNLRNTLFAETDVARTSRNLLDAVGDFAARTLRPAALKTDAQGVGVETIDELRRIGALSYMAPVSLGGLGLGIDTDRAVHELLAGACLNTWLVWVQHTGMVQRLATQLLEGKIHSALAESVVDGSVFAGAALSDVRHYPERFISARRVDGGWLFNGVVSWFTGWGMNSAIMVAGVDPLGEEVITALVPLGEGFRATPLPLAAVSGSHTVKLELHEVFVPDGAVTDREEFSVWRERDGRSFNDAKPSTFGLIRAVAGELSREKSPEARAVAAAWAPRVEWLRSESYSLDEPQDDEAGSAQRLARRAEAAHVLLTLAQALLTSRAGRGVTAENTALLHVRNALFLQVQGQTPAIRAAQLQRFLPAATA